jgi:hypothetical protein
MPFPGLLIYGRHILYKISLGSQVRMFTKHRLKGTAPYRKIRQEKRRRLLASPSAEIDVEKWGTVEMNYCRKSPAVYT